MANSNLLLSWFVMLSSLQIGACHAMRHYVASLPDHDKDITQFKAAQNKSYGILTTLKEILSNRILNVG